MPLIHLQSQYVPPVGTITIDSVTPDNVINQAESLANVTITGTVTGDAEPGDDIVVTVGGSTFNTTVTGSNTWSVIVPGATLAANTSVEAHVTGNTSAGHSFDFVDVHNYIVDLFASATITISTVAGNDEITYDEFQAGGNMTISGTVGGDATTGDSVVVTVNGIQYNTTVSGTSYSVGVPVSELAKTTVVLVQVTGTDDYGNPFSSSDSRSYVVTPGEIYITGNVNVSDTLTINVEQIYDPQGLGPFTYQWYRDGVPISGATGVTYTLVATDEGAFMTVELTFTDGQSNPESYLSAAVGPVTNVFNNPTEIQTIPATTEYPSVWELNHDGSLLALGYILYNGNAGRVDLYDWNGSQYVFNQTIVASDVSTDWYFGVSISMTPSGDRIIVGAYGADSLDGAVYVFDKSGATWVQTEKVLPPGGPGLAERFGYNIQLTSDGTKFVETRSGVSGYGACSVFHYSGTFSQFAVMEFANASPYSYYGLAFATGISISGDGNIIVVSGSAADLFHASITFPSAANEGGATIYKWNGSSYVVQHNIMHTVPKTGDGTTYAGDFFRVNKVSENGDYILGATPNNWSTVTYRYRGKFTLFKNDGLDNWSSVYENYDVTGANVYNGQHATMSDDGLHIYNAATGYDYVGRTDNGIMGVHDGNGTTWSNTSYIYPFDSDFTYYGDFARIGQGQKCSGDGRFLVYMRWDTNELLIRKR